MCFCAGISPRERRIECDIFGTTIRWATTIVVGWLIVMATNNSNRIVVGTDGSDNSLSAVRWALREATLRNATVDLVHTWNYTPIIDPMGMGTPVMVDPTGEEKAARQVMTNVMRRVDADRGKTLVNEIVTQGSPAQALLSASKGADLLVVGRRGHGGFLGLLLGSVATQVVNHATCPVVVVGIS